MNDTRYKNLYDALTSHIDYCNFLETYGKDFVTFENTNFDLLQTIYGAFSLTQLMDDYFIKKDNKVTCTIIPEALKQMVEQVAVYNGSGYTVGDLMYHDEYTVLEKLRNKLAHGDFIIRDGEIIFEENKVEGRVKVNDFLKFICALETEAELYTLSSPYKSVFNKCNIDKDNLTRINTEEEFDEMCNNLYRIDIVDTPLSSTGRDFKYITLRNMFYAQMRKGIGKYPLPMLEKYLKEVESNLKQCGIQITYSIKNIKTLKHYPNIKEKYMSMIDTYQKLNPIEQINRINNLSFILGNGQYQKVDIRKGLQLNRYIMKELQEHPEYTLKKIVTENRDITHLVLYHLDSAVLGSYLVGFNAAYEYGLEKGLTQKGNYNLVSIFEGKSLDFSKLEIDTLDDPNMLIEHTFTKYLSDVSDYESKKINEANRLIKKLRNNLEQYTNNCKNQDQIKIAKFKEEIKDAEMLKTELQMDIIELKEFANNFDLDKYTRNINIITHIRNAIAHGNVFVDSYATDISETDIIFRDYLDGQIVYEKKMKIKDFVLLFHSTNIRNVYTFITNNINDKTLIDEDYYENIVLRSILREIRENDIKKKIKHD